MERQKQLTEIANSYGTDKGTIGPSLFFGAHNYTDIYEAYFSSLRNEHLNILEIGIGVKGDKWKVNIVQGHNKSGGASLKMWYDYFPNAKIFGIDVNPANHIDNDRIKTFVVDQGNVEQLEFFLKEVSNIKFDFIFDDGSHRPDHQQTSLGLLFHKLKSGGVYFIEDLDNNGLGDNSDTRHTCETVYSTRKVMHSFVENKAFLKPNSIVNENYLNQNISSVIFYAPLPAIIPKALLSKLIGKRGMLVQYRQNSERLCAIKKINTI